MNQNKSKQFGLTISTLVLLAACASPTETMLSDGTVALRIDCDSTAGGMNYCLERAGKSCAAAGYTIVDQDGQVVSGSNASDLDMKDIVKAYETDRNSILVRCGS